jgi:hypothetical protein
MHHRSQLDKVDAYHSSPIHGVAVRPSQHGSPNTETNRGYDKVCIGAIDLQLTHYEL